MLIDKDLHTGDIVKTEEDISPYWLCTSLEYGQYGYMHMGYRTGVNNLTVNGSHASYEIDSAPEYRCSSASLSEGAHIVDRINAAELAKFNNEMAMLRKIKM